MFADSHCHLNYKGLIGDQEAVLARAAAELDAGNPMALAAEV